MTFPLSEKFYYLPASEMGKFTPASLPSVAWRLRASSESKMPDNHSCLKSEVSVPGMTFMAILSTRWDFKLSITLQRM